MSKTFTANYLFRIVRLQNSHAQPKQMPVAKPSKVSGDKAPVLALLKTESTNKARNTSVRTAYIRNSFCMCAPEHQRRPAADMVSDAKYDIVSPIGGTSRRAACRGFSATVPSGPRSWSGITV
jgi:hypothetical protein